MWTSQNYVSFILFDARLVDNECGLPEKIRGTAQ
jgi:hypothetical protein